MSEIQGIHIISAHREDLLNMAVQRGMAVFRRGEFIVLVEPEELPVRTIEDEIKDLTKLVVGEYKEAIKIHRALQPTSSDQFINNKMKWKTPREQRHW